jgi:hypothetical protein
VWEWVIAHYITKGCHDATVTPVAASNLLLVSLACPGSFDKGAGDLDAKVEQQVKKTLAALAKAQRPDGSWATKMSQNQQAKVATTSFRALTLMTAGKKYQANVNGAASFVSVNLLQANPLSRLPPAIDQPNWKIAIGGLFLCEYYAYQKKFNPKFKAPAAERAGDGAPGREVVGQLPPLAAGAQQVEEGIDRVTALDLDGVADLGKAARTDKGAD